MNARTCLLCGKSLSRIWVGAGEDFCSREHRNQYRLRRGMDRLQEANKVASLMRNSENPKPISCDRQAGNDSAREADATTISIAAMRRDAALPASRWQPPVTIPAARGFIGSYWRRVAAGKSRAFGISWNKTSRLQLKMGTRPTVSASEQYLERVKQPRSLRMTAQQGRLLRVSAAAGFRLPAMRAMQFRVAAARTAIRGMDQPRAQSLSLFDWPTDYRAPWIKFRIREICELEFTAPVYQNVIGARGPITFPPNTEGRDGVAAVRPGETAWKVRDPAMPRPIRHEGRRVSTPQHVALRAKPVGGDAMQHMVLMPLLPEDRAFSYVPAITTAPARPAAVSRPAIEDQFDSGLRNWTGGVGDWQIDVAGVRPGPLALFIPTLDQSDYEMEFLTHIDDRSVTWAFRASGLNDYYRGTITLSAARGCEFTRGAVIRGVAESVPAVRADVGLQRKTAITVRLRAVGNEFTVWANGQAIDTWTDSRFPKGGIGFLGAPDDRARIYWVRLSSPGSLGKEYPRR